MVALKERLSLEWLKEARAQKKGRSLSPDIEVALLTYGGELLSALRRRSEKSARLHDLVRDLGFRLQDTLPVVDYLIAQGYLRKAEDDPIVANHLLALTPRGERPAG